MVLCVSRAVLSVVLGAWSVRFVGWADWIDCRCFLSFVFLGVARCLELSQCNTSLVHSLPAWECSLSLCLLCAVSVVREMGIACMVAGLVGALRFTWSFDCAVWPSNCVQVLTSSLMPVHGRLC